MDVDSRVCTEDIHCEMFRSTFTLNNIVGVYKLILPM